MIVFFQILSVVLSAGMAVAWEFKLKQHKKSDLIVKLTTLLLVLVFVMRFLGGSSSVLSVVELSFLDFSKTSVAMSTLSAWFTITVIVLVFIEAFYSTKVSKALMVYFALPLALFNIICFSSFIKVNYNQYAGGLYYPIIYCLETAIVTALILVKAMSLLMVNNRFKLFNLSKKQWILFAVAVVSMLIVSANPNTARALLGSGQRIVTKEFAQWHRILLYINFGVPIALYFALRNRSNTGKMQAMLYISLGTLFNFATQHTFRTYLSLSSLPLHICNTMLYIFMISLVFKWKKLFYFNYFINVLGSLLAMLMPNYSDSDTLFSWTLQVFWVNHIAAFAMPLLCVALKIFPRPNIKYFAISMASFCVYFAFVLFVNAFNTAKGTPTDFFFINTDYVAEQLGLWAERLRDVVFKVDVAEYTLTFYPLYQFLYFFVYCLAGGGMWFMYNLGFRYADQYHQTTMLHRCIRKEEQEFVLQMQQLYTNSGGRFAFLRKLGRLGKGAESLLNAPQLLTNPISPDGVDMIKITNFSKQYGKSNVFAVKDVSLEVKAGEIFGFLGPNGAGKSTIIKSLVGIQTITSGKIEVCGFDVVRQSVQAKLNIGFVPDHYALYERLTGREYINYMADIYKVSKEDRDARISDYLERFELAHAFDNQMRTYSHGMKQKIAIMAALVHNPKIWILDEPLTGLDPNSIFQVKEVMRKHASEGNIVFFSSHIMDVVERLCHRFAVIKKGNIIARGTMDDITNQNTTLEEFYLGLIEGKGAEEALKEKQGKK